MRFEPYDHYELVTDPDENRQWMVRRLRDGRPLSYGGVHLMCRWLHAWGPIHV